MLGNTGSKQPRRIVAYVRVSRVMGREGEGYISPAVQEEGIRRWAQYAGAEVVAVLLDEDVSGGTRAAQRPGMREAFAMIEAGDADDLAVAKLNRFSRSTLGALRDLERLEELGGAFVSVEEELDTGTPTGRFALTMLLAVATLERDNIVAGWHIAKARAVHRGATIGPTPYGYRRAEAGRLEPDPVAAPIVLEAFRRAANGPETALDYLREVAPERTWTTFTVRRFLAQRVYLGESRYGDLFNTDAHLAIVSRGVFEAAQHAPRTDGRRPAADFPLSGIARCANCGERLVGGRGGRGKDGRGLRVYRCRASLAGWKGVKCEAPTNVTADKLERYVIDAVASALAERPALVAVAEGADLDLGAAESQLEDLEAELTAFAADQTARSLLGERGYHDALGARVQSVEDAREALRDLAAQDAARDVIALDAAELHALSPADLREVLSGGLDAIVVAKGRGSLEDRVRFIPKGDNAAAG